MAKSAALKKPTATKAPAAVKAAPAPVAAAEAGHNDKFGSGLDPKREAVFIREFQNIQDAETDMAEKKGAMSGIYKRLESAGFSKDHITFAKTLTKKNVAEVIADFTMKIAICRIMGHAAGRQLDMLDKDRTPIEDMAYGDGLAAGKLGKAPANPYGMETMAGQRWQQGMSDGNAFRNQALNEAINGPSISSKGPAVKKLPKSAARKTIRAEKAKRAAQRAMIWKQMATAVMLMERPRPMLDLTMPATNMTIGMRRILRARSA
jgi:hypothetical protein